MTAVRDLAPRERALLARLLTAVPFPGSLELERQLPLTKVGGGRPTFLELQVSLPAKPSQHPDGPLPVRAIVEKDGRPTGEILVWTKGGYLSGLEHAWFTAEAPEEMPDLEHVRISV